MLGEVEELGAGSDGPMSPRGPLERTCSLNNPMNLNSPLNSPLEQQRKNAQPQGVVLSRIADTLVSIQYYLSNSYRTVVAAAVAAVAAVEK